ncbi:MAG: DPP IV N-terminal domain-containing protein [Bacteroidetes bacterium]|nr:DPP IV N-terminal domain-containing protein [Bacteroidota bacterium]
MKNAIKISVLGLLLLLSSLLSAQTKQLNLDELISNRKLYATSLSNLQWMDESGNYTWVANNKLVKANIKTEKKDTILDLDAINKGLKHLDEKDSKRFPSISWIDNSNFTFTYNNKIFNFDILKKEVVQLNRYPEKAENIDVEPKTFNIAYTIENNLYISYRGTDIAVTEDKEKGIVNGQSVHRNEFGIKKGSFWSPKGNLLAFYRMDETMVTDYPLVDITTREAELKSIKYPMAGMKSHHVTVGVFDPILQKTVFLKTGEPAEQYLTNISWSPDEKYIFIAALNRDQNHLKINKYDVASGEFIATLFEEKNEKYVEPEHGLYFLKSNPNQFLWLSERDGYNHIYLYNIDGSLVKQLTKGNWIVKEIEAFDAKGNKVFISATKESPLDNDIYVVDIKTSAIKLITATKGTHYAIIDKGGNNIIDNYSNTETARKIVIENSDGKVLREVFEDKNPVKDYKLGETNIFTIKAKDGTDLYCRMIKPADFDASKKYPVIVYVYGGPHAQLVTNSWLGGANLFFNYLAQQGYIVFTMDNRGSANRGFAFESAIHRNVGTIEVADQMEGVAYLKSLPYVDANRLGVDGWSYGGFMTISMKLKNPGVFKVATAGGPVIDWKWYEVMYGERYMDTPEQNPEGYKNASLLNYVDKLEGKLLIIQGGVDNTVVPQHSSSFLKKCIDLGKQVDYFIYPTHEHNVSGIDRTHLYRKIYEYYKQNL